MTQRVDDFEGDDKRYIAYLEGEIRRLRQSPNTEDNQLRPQPSSKESPPTSPAWRRHADALIKRTPPALAWWSALRSEGIYDVMYDGVAVAFLLGERSTPATANHASTICDESMTGDELALLRHVAHYAATATQRRLTASVATRLVNFQLVLVLSACAVIRAVAQPTVSEHHILGIVKICLGDISDQYCRRMMDTAVYVNKLIDLLNAHGWDGRGAELLLWWNRAPSFYYSLSRSSKESLEYLSNELTKPEFTQNVGVPSEWTPFFLPGLVSQITQKEYQ
ncbi:uncharacterized protein LTR77_010961 [Saxophila tyrrhenica]|uniref:Uncharacterized protein n=1 Tax=Saxophila tyrrhenica TaxID=1690608 RepID=A0AAV9NTT3_9PEZI|nr:hypothetical protein LTR77_010961 [Saxophila tyrrhenica]